MTQTIKCVDCEWTTDIETTSNTNPHVCPECQGEIADAGTGLPIDGQGLDWRTREFVGSFVCKCGGPDGLQPIDVEVVVQSADHNGREVWRWREHGDGPERGPVVATREQAEAGASEFCENADES